MKKILFTGLLALLFVDCFAQNEYKIMAVGFYNCENFYDTLHDPGKKDEDFTPGGSYHYTDAVYRQKVHNIATVIEKMGTDVTIDGPAVMGLAEIENDKALSDLVAQPELISRHYKYTWFRSPDERDMSTALIYNPKYLKVLSEEAVHVPTESLPAKRATRDILHVYGILAGDTVHLFVNQWPSRFGGEPSSESGRKLAASISKRISDSILNLNPNTKILILGDFNENPNSDDLVRTLEAKGDKDKVELAGFYNPWVSKYKKRLGTENYHDEWDLPDQIILSGAFIDNNNNKWKYHNSGIFNKEFLQNKTGRYKGLPHRSFTAAHVWDNGYSNHLPVLIYLVEKK